MQVLIVGTGPMGAGMGARLAERGHQVYGYDTRLESDPHLKEEIMNEGITPINSYEQMKYVFPNRKIILAMVPEAALDSVIKEIMPFLNRGDIFMDGGNSYFLDTRRRAETFRRKGMYMLGIGVSGGVDGRETGYCLMVGGKQYAYNIVKPILSDLAAPLLPPSQYKATTNNNGPASKPSTILTSLKSLLHLLS